ncbi:sensor histidine kinase [Abyssalbus ytuae]|uniref:Histidine kinase n=1 Tax=Abyssalbus ytuae TaxID=2926907 RepID=A0A9E6ZKP1_9FLAO|nr:histidine kinase [Abyssalbus ytuae]UOB16354.1 histidine kinase [Abyssalbus ytuae]
MQLSGKKRNLVFYTLQVFGWGGLFLFSYVVTPKESLDKPASHYIISFGINFIFGILSTSLLREYVKKYVRLDDINFKEIIKLILSGLVCVLFYIMVAYLVLFVFYLFIPELDLKKDFSEKILLSFFGTSIIVYGWLLCYIFIKLVFKLNTEKIERLELNSNLKESQLNTLKGQINPHFMFNSLNNIRGLMLEDVEKSREMLTRLSDMLRYSLTKNDLNAIELEEEIEMVENYILLSKIQLENRLTFKTNIAPEALKAKTPPMVVQMLVENAVKHGISELKKGGVIVLNAFIENRNLHLEVINTGKISEKNSTTKLGLNNIQKRLSLLYGDKAVFSLEEINNEVVATIIIPQS